MDDELLKKFEKAHKEKEYGASNDADIEAAKTNIVISERNDSSIEDVLKSYIKDSLNSFIGYPVNQNQMAAMQKTIEAQLLCLFQNAGIISAFQNLTVEHDNLTNTINVKVNINDSYIWNYNYNKINLYK